MSPSSTPTAARKITRRSLLQTGAALTLAAAAPAVAADLARPRRPNILLLMDDQHRADCLGAAGNRVIRTPNLDRLAAEGALFRKAYTSLPSCMPARASLLTGQSPWGHGLLAMGVQAEHYPHPMPRTLHDAGYYAIAIGKNHFHPAFNTHGYDKVVLYDQTLGLMDDYTKWFAQISGGKDLNGTGLGYNDRRAREYVYPEQWHCTYWTGQQAVDFLGSYHDDRPFFLKVSFIRPHSPYDPPRRFMDMYKDADLPAAFAGAWAETRFGSFTNPDPPDEHRANLPADAVRLSRQGYYGCVTFVDEQMGRILDVLEKRGFLENTLILLCADHGDMLGDHHLWRKTQPYESSSRIPLVVRWPDGMASARRGQVFSELVELRDVMPTFLDAAGASCPPTVEGRSLLDILRGSTVLTTGGRASDWRTVLDLEHGQSGYRENIWTALTDGRFKYIYCAFDGTQQLFDLDNDPCELTDLSSDAAHAPLLRQWRQRMIDHLSVRGPLWVANGDLTLRQKPMYYGANYPGKI